MDEKTEQLRDIFMDVTESESVTESQAAGRGSLTDTDEAAVAERLGEVISRMRERYDFLTGLDDGDLVTVVREFYAGADDDAIAEAVDATADGVVEARLDLHLVRDADLTDDVDVAAFRRRVVGGETPGDDVLASEFDLESETAAHLRRVVETQAAARQVSHRFQSEFEDALAEAGLAAHHTAAMQESGLDEATEDIDSLDSDADVSM
jgi:hypothetical protein